MQGRSRTNKFICYSKGFLGDTVVKNLLANAGDTRDVGLIPGLGRSSERGHGNPLLENPHGQRTLAGYSTQGIIAH